MKIEIKVKRKTHQSNRIYKMRYLKNDIAVLFDKMV